MNEQEFKRFVGENLTEAREAASRREGGKLSQNEVERRTRKMGKDYLVSTSTLSNYESGNTMPSLRRFLILCDMYKANPTWVLTRKGIMEWLPGESAKQDQKHLARWLRTIAAYLDRATEEGRDVVGVLTEVERGKVEAEDIAGKNRRDDSGASLHKDEA